MRSHHQDLARSLAELLTRGATVLCFALLHKGTEYESTLLQTVTDKRLSSYYVRVRTRIAVEYSTVVFLIVFLD